MNTQEILNNLAGLEKELQNIKSARVMAEETISSYQETQKEIEKLINGLGQVGASLVTLAKGLKSQDAALSERIRDAVGKMDQELSSVKTAFQDSCEKSNASFNESVAKSLDSLRHEIDALSEAFEKGNGSFKQNINKLEALGDSITTANNDVKDVKAAVDAFRSQLENSCNKQDEAFAGIERNCHEMGAKMKDIEEREKAVEDRLAKIESFIADDSDIRKSNYGSLQKSSRNIQIYLVIALFLLIFSLAYPFAKDFLQF